MKEEMKLETPEEALRNALAWYGEQARLARLNHSEGDPGRWALSDDGGKRAREVLDLSASPAGVGVETAPPSTHSVVTLADCHIGLFRCGGELCLKTEYGSNEGRIDAYIVSSGEFFWGGTNTPAAQRKVMVEPVSEIAVLPAPVSNVPVLTEAQQQAQAALDKVMNCRFSNFDAGAVVYWAERGLYQVKANHAPASRVDVSLTKEGEQ